MSIYDWKDEYSIGIPFIDGQHKKIIDLIEELIESIRDSRDDYIIGDVLNDLTEYSKSHFGVEERLLKKYDYFEEPEHEARHREFAERVNELKSVHGAHYRDIPKETLNLLKSWFFEHELTMDASYIAFFRGKGLDNQIQRELAEGKI